MGPIGPAGENGSVMWAGPDAPTENIGNEGDYYLDSTTGEFYGPKDADGWGEPIIVLMGEDGKDGQDGEDGQDGNQIHSGSGAPDASLGKEGDFYLDKSSYDLYGPKTGKGWGSPLNLKGADGNANVTRYIFPGHDFSDDRQAVPRIPNIQTEAEMQQSAWLEYFFNGSYYEIPGYGFQGLSRYRMFRFYGEKNNEVGFAITLAEGPGEAYQQIEIVRIEASNTEDLTGVDGHSLMPDDLDISNYEAVAEYYGFGNDQNK